MFIVDLVVTGLVLIPYFLLIYIGKKQSLEIDKTFQHEIIKNKLNIDVSDRWNQNAIGIDYQKQKLLFVQRRNDFISIELLDLSTVTTTNIVPFYNRVKINKVIENQLDKLHLELTHSYGNTLSHLLLFDSDFTYGQFYEMKYAEKWNSIIYKAIRIVPTERKIAS